ncbi:MAG: hypothetical protein ACXVJZ_16085 [Acidimicrobiia bacterium]
MRLVRPAFGALVTASALAVAATTSAVAIPPARAGDDRAAVSTDPVGAHVELRHHDTWIEVRAHDGSAPTGCRRRWVLSPGAFALRRAPAGDYRPVPMPPAPGAEFRVFHVFCDDDYVTSVWLRPQQFGVDPRDLAERLVRDLPYPAATVGANPSTRGLTGLASWFWVQGYTGTPITDTVTDFGVTVTVEATPVSAHWDFGDGAEADGLGLGVAPPAPDPVVHTFERRANPAYTVRAIVSLAVRWRLGTGPWQDLPPVLRRAVAVYPVVESRAVLVPDR